MKASTTPPSCHTNCGSHHGHNAGTNRLTHRNAEYLFESKDSFQIALARCGCTVSRIAHKSTSFKHIGKNN